MIEKDPFYKIIFHKIFDVENIDRVPITKDELYLLLSFYNLTIKTHSVSIEECLENHNIPIRDKSGRLPRYTIDNKQVRSYLLWKIHSDWEPSNLEDITNVTKVLELKSTINNRKTIRVILKKKKVVKTTKANSSDGIKSKTKNTSKRKSKSPNISKLNKVDELKTQNFVLIEKCDYSIDRYVPYKIRIYNHIILILLEFLSMV